MWRKGGIKELLEEGEKMKEKGATTCVGSGFFVAPFLERVDDQSLS
jgi:hypothetical protein